MKRFWEKVDKSGECWLWTAGLDKHGYGQFWDGRRQARAHRIAYALERAGPGDRRVLHRCDNPPCVNPAHLFLGTMADNSADMVEKGRSAKGERHSQAVLTEALVCEMRRSHALGYSMRQVAKDFGVNNGTAYYALTGRTWRHIPMMGG